jgi:hypothetical protein
MMKFLFGLSLVVGFLFAFVKMGGVSGSSFDYETATPEERKAWMDEHGRGMQAGLRMTLPSGGGPTQPEFYFDHMKNDPARREMEMVIRVKIPSGRTMRHIPDSVAMPKLCKIYVGTALHKHKVRVVAGFYRAENGKPAGVIQKIVVSASKCDQYSS